MSDQSFAAAELPHLLSQRVPELAPALEQETAFWASNGVNRLGPDVAFGIVLAPFVVERLRNDSKNDDEVLRRIFGLLEELASSTDDGVLSAIDVSFGEELLAHPAECGKARAYMGPRLRETFDLAEAQRRRF